MPPSDASDRVLSAKLRSLPSVDFVLSQAALAESIERWGRATVVAAVRAELSAARSRLRASRASTDAEAVAPAASVLAIRAATALAEQLRTPLRAVINATGVVLHTNLGRAPISAAAARAMSEAAAGYSNLEFDLDTGGRGSRTSHLESMLRATTGAETGIAVNNNAAALYLSIAARCAGREVIVSRGQAVEIGGGFRIPDVLRDAGATLVEVGTTNRTRASDYADAVSERTAALLRVHPSNFRVIGFTETPSLCELRGVADRAGALLIDDLGSGCLLDSRGFGLEREPRPQDSVAAGADLVLFSGDKLLGGPQAGLIVGPRDAVSPLRTHPLMRVLRPDKTVIAGLAATLQHYLANEAVSEVPVWRMIAATPNDLQQRAAAWRDAVGAGEVVESRSAVGGGSLPGETLPTYVWSLEHPSAADAVAQLRAQDAPIIARVEHGRLLFDPRTMLPGEDAQLVQGVRRVLGGDE